MIMMIKYEKYFDLVTLDHFVFHPFSQYPIGYNSETVNLEDHFYIQTRNLGLIQFHVLTPKQTHP